MDVIYRGGGRFNTYGITSTAYNTYFNSTNVIKFLNNPEFTLSFWGKFYRCGDYAAVLFGHNIAAYNPYTGLAIYCKYGAGDNRYGLAYNSYWYSAGSNSGILTNSWIHFAITKDENNLMILYKNGVRVAAIQPSIPANADKTLFYNYFRAYDAWSYRYILGTIDDILICDKVLFKENFEVPSISNLQIFYAQYGTKIYEDQYDNAYTIPKQSELI